MPGFNITPTITLTDGTVVPIDDCGDKKQAAFLGPGHTMEVARKHRFKLELLEPFGYSGTGILLFLEKCTRPTPEIDEITIHNAQDEIYRPGKQRWGPVEFTFYEKSQDLGDSQLDEAAERIYYWWGQTMIKLNESTHNRPTNYYKNAQLQMLDGIGAPIWTYHLYECWPQKVTPIDLSYSDSDLATITVTLRFNKAEERRLFK